ncbi:MAG: Zn-ribbon domain-containing OB-fold protein [Chloroflexi bacterium]|nr:Zn-ribbon domain-containing OB-fold protein [Chloroflexota bacterium]
MTTNYANPLPNSANPEQTRPFWEATKRHELVMPRCKTCAATFFYPRERCPDCLSNDLEWVSVSGRGRVYSFTVVYQPGGQAFRDDTPYVYAMIQLDEGPMMVSNLVECPVEDAKIDMQVVAVFEDVTPDVTLVKFKPA